MKTPAVALLFALLASPTTFAQDSFFPIWGNEAEKLGYTLPKPYGISVSYMDMSNPVTVDSIELTGAPMLEAIDIDAKNATFTGSNITVRADVWVFPFMNVYGIIGYTQGESKAKINSVSCDSSKFDGPNLLCGVINAVGDKLPENTMFNLEMDGGTYGIGTTLAGGVGNWFALLDMNYTYTSISAIEGDIRTFVAAPRVGYRWEYDGGRELRVFTGVMYQKVDQFLVGDIASLGLPSVVVAAADKIAKDAGNENAGFEVSQHASSNWNNVVGMQYAFNRDWDVLIEAGFGARESLFFALGRRF
ncbi:hypothetical protein [Photobacterium sanguinicancri]|uniref:Outer membrane protein beta-barrel domain-containing protein n=2 Tax=Photobacterium sanguinicancri TaxID=875932 RepID=A0AAW7Y472_9GAMM|nr:hypothetical protein [Photobacterium sanguinicancri]MDO6542128.1 hypothetical protein [Photobacterium sanguinicancri]